MLAAIILDTIKLAAKLLGESQLMAPCRAQCTEMLCAGHLPEELICELHQLVVSATELRQLILHTDCDWTRTAEDIHLESLRTLVRVCLPPTDCAMRTEILRDTTHIKTHIHTQQHAHSTRSSQHTNQQPHQHPHSAHPY